MAGFYDFDDPETCETCKVELPETNDTGFCGATCEDAYIAAAAREILRGPEAMKLTDDFEIPKRLIPSTILGLALTEMFYSTPANERV